MRKFLSRSEGFTLIELMIVILIMAILVAIAVPVFLNARSNAQKRTCQANLRTIDGSVQSYQAMFDDAREPTSLSQLLNAGTKVLKKNPRCPTAATGTPGDYSLVGSVPPEASCPNDPGHTI